EPDACRLLGLAEADEHEACRPGEALPAPEDGARRLDLLRRERIERVTGGRDGMFHRLHEQPPWLIASPRANGPTRPPGRRGRPLAAIMCSLREPVNRSRWTDRLARPSLSDRGVVPGVGRELVVRRRLALAAAAADLEEDQHPAHRDEQDAEADQAPGDVAEGDAGRDPEGAVVVRAPRRRRAR